MSSYWGEISKDEMGRVVAIAKQAGWKKALDSVSTNHNELANYLMSYARANWLSHSYAPEHSQRCLDLGSGWGSLSFVMPDYYDETVSLERVALRREFQALRAKEENPTGLTILAADMLSLPFSGNCFDLIIANNVLEWAAFQRHKEPRVVQLDFLREIRRCLKKGGCLYIGIENRFGINYLLGDKDHTRLPFTSILPRKLSDVVVKHVKGWKRYDTLTYTALGYTSMLRDAGYDPVEICWAYPSHNYPRFFGELYDPGSYFFFSRWASLAHRDLSLEERFFTEAVAKMPRFILKQIMPLVWPRFLIFAWKDFKPKTFQNEVSKLTRTRSTVCLSGGSSPYSKVTFVGLQSGKPVSFSKFDRRFPSDSEKLLSQENLARQYAGVQYARHNMFGTEVFVEKPLKGRHVNPYDFDESLAAVKWLFDFQDRTVSRTSFDDSDSVIRKVSQHCSPSKAKELREHIKGFFDLCTDLDISSCAEHGDFWSGNILIDATTVYVLDWEFYRKVGNPIFDFCFFLIANARHDHKLFEEGRRDHKLFEENLFGGTSYSIVVSKLVRYFCRRRKLPQEVVWRGVPYALARSVARASIYSDTPSSRCYYFLKLMDAWFNRSSRSEHLWVNGPAEI